MSRTLLPVVLSVVSLVPVYAGQDQPIFKSRSDLVQVHVNVFDGGSDAVTGLTRDNFLVFEDGRNQEITFFNSEDVPVAVGLVIDNSSSMIAKGPLVTGGGMAFAESSHPEDELFVISFNERVRHALPPTQPFTSSRPLLRATLAGLHAGGQTALHDAVIEALDHVEKATHQKHVIIVLSDGEDNASRHSREQMYDRAARSDAIIYAVATSDPRFGGGGDPGVLRKLARIGGGMAFFPRSREEVVTVLMETAENIRRGYSIGYTPTNLERDGRFRRIKVMVRANGRSLTARYRDGYTAPGPSSTK